MTFKRFRLCLSLLFLVGIPGTYFIWERVEIYRLDKVLTKLHAAGEPITSQEFNLNPVSDEHNSSLDYLAAGKSINVKSPNWKTYDRADAPYQYPLTDTELNVVQDILAENAIAISYVVAARGKRAGGWNDNFNHSVIGSEYDFNSERSLSNLLGLAAIEAHQAGNDLVSIQYLNDMLCNADASEHRPTLVGHLVAIGETAAASESIAHLCPDFSIGANGLSRTEVSDLIKHLQNEKMMNDGIKLSWRTDRIQYLNAGLDFVRQIPSVKTLESSPIQFLKPTIINDCALVAQHLQDVMIASTSPDWPAAQSLMPTTLPRLIRDHPYFHLSASIAIGGYESAVKADYRGKAERRLAAIALCVRMYSADHSGQLPHSLSELMPDYLPTIPIDPMSGQFINYKSDPPRIYSVGDDGIDDGGVPINPDAKDHFHRHHGDMVVYLKLQSRKIVPTH